MNAHHLRPAILALSIFATLLVTPSAFGQNMSARGTDNQRSVNPSDLAAFVRTYIGLQKIRAHYAQPLETTEGPQQKQDVIAEVSAKIASLLEREGLSLDRYNQIFVLVSNDEGLRQKTLELIGQERSKS